MIQSQKIKYQLIAIVLLTILLRSLIVMLFPSIGDPDSMDSKSYNLIAFQVMEGKGFSLYDQPTAYVAPLLPFFLAGVYIVFGVHFWIVKLIFIFLAAISVILVYQIAIKLYHPQIGVIAALLFAMEPSLCGITAYIYTESFNILLLLAAMLCLIDGFQSGGKNRFVFAGIFMGLTTLCKGTTLLFPFFMAALLIICPKTRIFWKQLFLFFLVFCIVLVPWTVRNYRVFHVFLPVATGAGESMWTGNYFPFDGEYRYRATQEKAMEVSKGLSWIERDRKLGAEARKMIFSNPGKFLKLSFKKIYRYWIKVYEAIPTGQKRSANLFIMIILGMTHWFLLLFSSIGMIQYEKKDVIYWVIILLLLYYLAIHVITMAIPRYRIPVIPYILPFAACSIYQCWAGLLRRLKNSSGNILN